MQAEASTVWLTGLSGSGKTTLAHALKQRCQQVGRRLAVLDGDAVRTRLCADLGFSEADRSENIRRVAEVARLMNESGLDVVCALISPSCRDREMARQVIGAGRFHEVYVATPLRVCEQRDPKGLYRKARVGAIAQFTGVSAPYEAPETPDLLIDTSATELPIAVDQLTRLLGLE